MRLSKQHIALFAVALAIMFGVSASRAANLTAVSVALSNHKPAKTGVTETITFKPATNITAPGDLKITYASQFDLTNVVASADVSVSGGGVTWNGVQNSDLNNVTNILTLGWASGTLTAGNTVTVTVAFTKNPASSGNYNVTIETGADGFTTATDSRTIPVVITDGGVGVTANVPYPETNPTITGITPTETIVVSSGATQVISFTLTDVNNNNLDYTATPSSGSISVAPSPATPVSSTQTGVTVTFTYFANGGTGSQTVTVTADDNEA
ncbi:MAG: hypothetical protein HY462_00455, partial [Parcubacteria group bacterium]|nr:hypothetical protein [Parcubacteria group bacterium]